MREKHQDQDFSTGKKLHKYKTDSVQICEKGTSKGSVPYKNGTTLTIKDGMIGRVYVRFVTDAGIDEMQLPGIAVDKKHQQRRRSRLTDQGSRR